ncbi:MAG: ABC transporter substrate-binding protein [Actinomycetota bacterium]|nr:ABC transporter substrate-binding protein [Actinomycetota bacterium]
MRPPRIVLALLATLALILTGCSSGESVPQAGGGNAGGGGGAGGQTLVAAIAAEPDQFDPHNTSAYAAFQVLENVYDTLVQPNAELEFEPALAESWETSVDGLTWTFRLRDGVRWHNGREFVADDVVYSMNRLKDGDLTNSYLLSSVAQVTASDPRTVVFTLSRPTADFLANIGGFKAAAIVARENVEDKTIASKPIGTGAFTFQSYTGGQGVQLARFDDYWGGEVALAGVQYRFIPEPTAALTALRTGEVQWTDNVPPQQVQALQGDDSVVLGQTESTDYWYVAPNHARAPFNDPRVRRALALAIDREAITQAATFGNATPNQTAIPPGRPYAVDYAPYERDVAEARRLIQEAGVAGRTVDLMVTSEYPETVTASEVIAAQLGEVGLNVQPRTLGFSQWLAEQTAGTFDMLMLGWLGNLDPDDYYYEQHHTNGSFNAQKYSNPAVDAALDQGRSRLDESAREQAYDTAVRAIVDDVSYVYLYNPQVTQAHTPQLTGYEVRADRAIRWAGAALEG